MYKLDCFKLFLFIFMNVVFFNITGCATHMVWEESANNVVTVIDKITADASGFYSKCSDYDPNKENIIIPYKINNSSNEFPPFNEGYVVIRSEVQAKRMISRINELQKDKTIKYFSVKTHLYKNTYPDSKIEYGLSIYRDSGSFVPSVSSDDTRVEFIPATITSIPVSNCQSLTNKPVKFEVVFIRQRFKYTKYKNSLGFRIAATPFSVASDVITSPVQLVLILTAPLWIGFRH